MSRLNRFKWFLFRFSRLKVPMIGYTKPKLIHLDDKRLVVCIALKRRTRNHLHSMYFGALAVGADLAGGMHAFYHADKAQCSVSLAFKSFEAQFFRRAESDVYFVCDDGALVKSMIDESKNTKERITKPVNIKAYTNYLTQPESIAEFILQLSLKVTH